jgi:Lrp/AsnC family leucine-responsive transcriptional regulator
MGRGGADPGRHAKVMLDSRERRAILGRNRRIPEHFTMVAQKTVRSGREKRTLRPLDEFDVRILEIVQENNRVSAEDLAAQVNLSPSACLRRLSRLRADGIIESDVSVIAPEAAGRGLTMIVEVTLERERADIISEFKATMQRLPEVMQCYYVTGDTDFLLIVTAPSMEDYEAFVSRFFFDNLNVRRFRTSVVMDRVKVGLKVPLDSVPR